MCHGRVKDAASYKTVTYSHPCAGQRCPVRHGGTHRCRPTNVDGLPRFVWGRVRHQTRYNIRPPSTTRDGVGTAAFGVAGDCAICGWRFGTLKVFRAVRGAAPSADGGLGRLKCFAPCAAQVCRPLRRAGISPRARGDQRPCLWTPRFFEKNRVKLLYFASNHRGRFNLRIVTLASPSRASAEPL